MKEKVIRLMAGRYGTDKLNGFLLRLSLAGCLLPILVKIPYVWFFPLLITGLAYFRMFSKNHRRRYEENMWYLRMRDRIQARIQKIRKRFEKIIQKLKDRKTHHIYRCPSCRQKVRVPRGKGKICITCPKCRTEFTQKS